MTKVVLREHRFTLDNATWSGERGFYNRVPKIRNQFPGNLDLAASLELINREYIPAMGRAVTAEDLLDATSGFLEISRKGVDQPTVALLGGYLEGVIEYCRDNIRGFEAVHDDWQKRARPVEAALVPGSF